jgi:hypothetical protein
MPVDEHFREALSASVFPLRIEHDKRRAPARDLQL